MNSRWLVLPKNESKDKFIFSIEELVSGSSILHSTGNPLASVRIWSLSQK